jgi:hypothetical protein
LLALISILDSENDFYGELFPDFIPFFGDPILLSLATIELPNLVMILFPGTGVLLIVKKFY